MVLLPWFADDSPFDRKLGFTRSLRIIREVSSASAAAELLSLCVATEKVTKEKGDPGGALFGRPGPKSA